VQTHTVQQPSPSVNGWSVIVPNDNRPIPNDLATLLNSRTNPTGSYQLVYYLNNVLGDRAARTDVFSYNMQGGFEGKIPGSDWTWELYTAKGQSETSSLLTGEQVETQQGLYVDQNEAVTIGPGVLGAFFLKTSKEKYVRVRRLQ
jgi:iron complex outermembrane recepter protein